MGMTIHEAMWRTYLSRQYCTPPANDVIDALAQYRKELQAPLLAIGLCNLLRAYPDDATPQSYKVLFKDVLRQEVGPARKMYAHQEVPIFPLNPGQIITEPVLEISDDLAATTVSLALCRQLSLNDPDTIERIIDPSAWSRCTLFWKAVTPGAEGTIEAQLNLPDPSVAKPVPVRIIVEKNRSPFEVRLDYEMTKNEYIDVCRGYLSAVKEPGRPGVTRTTQQRTIRFMPGQLNEWRLMTTLYWIQAEMVSVVFGPHRPPHRRNHRALRGTEHHDQREPAR